MDVKSFMKMFNGVKLVKINRAKIAAIVIIFLFLRGSLFDFIVKWKSLLQSWRYYGILCHYSLENDALPSAESNDFSPSNKSIFFLETSCRRSLTSRDLCAIESAARTHPDYQTIVLFSAPISEEIFEHISLYQKFDNIRFARIHIDHYSKKTPVQEFVRSGALDRSKWGVEHTSDMLRFLTLYKYGGIYLDLDVVVAKRLDNLAANWAARESEWTVSNGALAFSMDSVDFEVYGPELFYPIKWQNSSKYFDSGMLENKDAYIYHVWNHMTRNRTPDKNSPYAQLARTFCPFTYALYGDRFGL
ncbi:Lactosylceramide 4-alpha-galactosyltransferase [Papilio xuthus]|uniref:Lactosylceramide 4-alpha-galactosyltransferase n=1 Tax=Papilio xuthus TaxID=66420 RepID=A0A194PJE5_PAPXU|nr:Lactosylceramide 4-alpha-galactosyltransferase [Papilio xuthus]